MTRRAATIVGDTSAFHSGSRANYDAFRRLVSDRYAVVQEIPYTAFGTSYLSFSGFCKKLRGSRWWSGLVRSQLVLVHGEGLTEFNRRWVYPYLYFGPLARELGIESSLVNFSMFDVEPFVDVLQSFSYVACRESETARRLSEYGIRPTMSFDCVVLTHAIEPYMPSDGTVAAVRGRTEIPARVLRCYSKVLKLNACWDWHDAGAVRMPTFAGYARRVRSADRVITTSFHGIILALLGGIPFEVLASDNPKYEALASELLPSWWDCLTDLSFRIYGSDARSRLRSHYKAIWSSLVSRARLNCPPEAGTLAGITCPAPKMVE